MGETDIQPCPNATGKLKLCRPCHVRMHPQKFVKSFNIGFLMDFQYILIHKGWDVPSCTLRGHMSNLLNYDVFM